MNSRIDIADRLNLIADEIQGISDILSIMRENEELQGVPAGHILLLQHDTGRLGAEIRNIAKTL